MSKLKLSDDLSLPIDAATQTFAFIARKGAGKTYAAGKLVELLLEAEVQVVILDTVGNWYGLRIAADGKGKGFDIPVFGGLRGDLPLESGAGELVADIAVDTGRSLILDVSQFSLGDRKRFATAFGERLWKKKKAESHPSPLMLVIEESQLIVPQFTGKGGGDEARMLGIYEEIIRLGRNYGIGCTMISQRPQSVNKEVLNQTECLFVGQVNGSQEREALKKWITHQGMDVGLVDELPGLPVGTMYAWSPQWLQILKKIKIGTKATFDASSTPKVGQKQTRRDPAPLDLQEIQQKMAAVVERAKENDPKLLRAELARVKAELVKTQQAPAPKAETKIVEKPVVTDAQVKRVEGVADRLEREGQRRIESAETLAASGRELIATAREFAAALGKAQAPIPTAAAVRVAPPPRPVLSDRSRAHSSGPKADSGSLPKGERSILIVSAQYPDGATKEQLTVMTGYKRSSRDTYLQRLRERGYIEQRGEMVIPTDPGIEALGSDYEPLPTGQALIDHWMTRLPEGERRVLEVVIDKYPEPVPRESIDEVTGYKRSSRDTYLQRLGSRRLVETSRDGVKASDQLFA
jgi:hypothetical protein